MAKDPVTGPVSKYDDLGNPIKEEPTEEPQAETTVEEADESETVVEETPLEEEILSRSEVINEFGEDLGGKLIESGYASFSAMADLDEETLMSLETLELDEKVVVLAFLSPEDSEEAGDSQEVDAGEGVGVIDDGPETAPTKEELEKQEEILGKEKEPSAEEIVYEFHEHRADAPFTYQQAKEALEAFDFYEMRELAKDVGIEPERKKDDLIQQLLDKWFPMPVQAPPDPPEGVSVRVKRIQEGNQ